MAAPVDAPKGLRMSWASKCIIIIGLFVSCSNALAGDPKTRYEKDGFIIDAASNGGNCVGCEWIVVDGKIPADAGEQLAAWVKRAGYENISLTVLLNSGGGNLVGGIKLGRAIRNLGLKTEIGRTVPDLDVGGSAETQAPGGCYSACAYAFLGGVERVVQAGEYGVHQFYSGAFFDAPAAKSFSAIDMSAQQVLTGALLAYVVEMGVDPRLVVEANKALPSEIFKPVDGQLKDWKVRYDPKAYGKWQTEAYKDGIVIFSRTQDERSQTTLFCTRGGAELLISHKGLGREYTDNVAAAYATMQSFDLFGRTIPRAATRLSKTPDTLTLRVPVSKAELDAMQAYKLKAGGFGPGDDEPSANRQVFLEDLPVDGLERHVRLLRGNCGS
ncbi:hypothetical protein [Methylorubrum extorquens]|uniref:Periplasmic protein-like protein n=1 Tax=Methylorubrum extorquens TaxID=408 RepID=A0AAX3WE19_METEX|nr:hypothetical protein [Methylorubrum extorquens]WHQ68613.1 hypothetical protein KEC54_19885 [Methylorubrum extorquens]